MTYYRALPLSDRQGFPSQPLSSSILPTPPSSAWPVHPLSLIFFVLAVLLSHNGRLPRAPKAKGAMRAEPGRYTYRISGESKVGPLFIITVITHPGRPLTPLLRKFDEQPNAQGSFQTRAHV